MMLHLESIWIDYSRFPYVETVQVSKLVAVNARKVLAHSDQFF